MKRPTLDLVITNNGAVFEVIWGIAKTQSWELGSLCCLTSAVFKRWNGINLENAVKPFQAKIYYAKFFNGGNSGFLYQY